MGQDTKETLDFASVSGKKVEGAFVGGRLSSDSGFLFLRLIDEEIGLIDKLSSCISDDRHPSHVDHGLVDLLRRRILRIACGYEDADDCDGPRSDPALKMACDRLPVTGADLGGRPTMCRLENSIRPGALYRLSRTLVDVFIASCDKAPEVIIPDMDDTDDVAHGDREGACFNGYHREHCHLPLHIHEGMTGELITAIPGPGQRPTGKEIVTIIKRLVPYLRSVWPDVMILLRGDSHFGCPEVHDFCEAHALCFVFGQARNERPEAPGAELLDQAKALAEGEEETVRLFNSFSHQATGREKPRRIIFKAEVTPRGPDPRFVVTHLESSRPSFIHERVYCQRGRMENFIRNHKAVLCSDRTSCHGFFADAFRLLLHGAAYVLLHTLGTRALEGAGRAKARFDTIRKRLLKVGACIRETARKIKVHRPSCFPLKKVYGNPAAYPPAPDSS